MPAIQKDGVEQLWESAGEAGQAVSGAVEEVEGVVQEGIDDVVASLGLDDGEDGMEGIFFFMTCYRTRLGHRAAG